MHLFSLFGAFLFLWGACLSWRTVLSLSYCFPNDESEDLRRYTETFFVRSILDHMAQCTDTSVSFAWYLPYPSNIGQNKATFWDLIFAVNNGMEREEPISAATDDALQVRLHGALESDIYVSNYSSTSLNWRMLNQMIWMWYKSLPSISFWKSLTMLGWFSLHHHPNFSTNQGMLGWSECAMYLELQFSYLCKRTENMIILRCFYSNFINSSWKKSLLLYAPVYRSIITFCHAKCFCQNYLNRL